MIHISIKIYKCCYLLQFTVHFIVTNPKSIFLCYNTNTQLVIFVYFHLEHEDMQCEHLHNSRNIPNT